MKKFTLILSLIISTYILQSCSDSSNTVGLDEIEVVVGEWEMTGLKFKGKDPETVTDCFKKGKIIFKADKTFTQETYTNEVDCNVDQARTGSGTFENKSSVEYTMRFNGTNTDKLVYLIPLDTGVFELHERDDKNSFSSVIYYYKRKK